MIAKRDAFKANNLGIVLILVVREFKGSKVIVWGLNGCSVNVDRQTMGRLMLKGIDDPFQMLNIHRAVNRNNVKSCA